MPREMGEKTKQPSKSAGYWQAQSKVAVNTNHYLWNKCQLIGQADSACCYENIRAIKRIS